MLFKLACYFPAENPLFIVVNLQSESWVQELSNAIAVELHSGGRTDVKLDDLRLFKVNLFFLS
jgi:hypothetical protein